MKLNTALELRGGSVDLGIAEAAKRRLIVPDFAITKTDKHIEDEYKPRFNQNKVLHGDLLYV